LLAFSLPYWLWRRPRALRRFVEALVRGSFQSAENLAENLLGIGFAIVRARRLARRVGHFHAVWASAPGAAAWALHELTDLPYSLSAHAYDLFENGGDALLSIKMARASFLRSSTRRGCRRWETLGADPRDVLLIRRGLPELPPFAEDRVPSEIPRLLAVGRMVEKMGFAYLLRILAALEMEGVSFRARLIGEGPLREKLQADARRLGLTGKVAFPGALSFAEVEKALAAADLFLFTGCVDRKGDRAGFPNAVGEAMAWGVPVAATPTGAVREGIRDRETGILLPPGNAPAAAVQVRDFLLDPALRGTCRQAARQWVEENFDARRNLRSLQEALYRTSAKPLRSP
jgi:glycosyltransferase involved in cell wall biosynthesis